MPWIQRPLFIPSVWVFCACALAVAGTPPGAPFMKPSPLPYQAPQFDQIHDGDYLPAIEAGMKAHLAEIQKIANDPAAPTFENTLVAIDRKSVV